METPFGNKTIKPSPHFYIVFPLIILSDELQKFKLGKFPYHLSYL